jgi:hypothetical protein
MQRRIYGEVVCREGSVAGMLADAYFIVMQIKFYGSIMQRSVCGR